jgi:hypothetical protein
MPQAGCYGMVQYGKHKRERNLRHTEHFDELLQMLDGSWQPRIFLRRLAEKNNSEEEMSKRGGAMKETKTAHRQGTWWSGIHIVANCRSSP